MLQRLDQDKFYQHFQKAVEALAKETEGQRAGEQLRKALAYNPVSYACYLNLACLEIQEQHYGKAAQYSDLAILCRPYKAEGYYNRGLSMMGKGNINEGIRDINAAISCLCLEIFKKNGDICWLVKAVENSEDNVEALRLLVIMGGREQFSLYQKKLQRAENSYQIEGPVQGQVLSENGFFRLSGNPLKMHQPSKALLKHRCSQYLHLMNKQLRGKLQKQSNEGQKSQISTLHPANLSISNVCSLKIDSHKSKEDQMDERSESSQCSQLSYEKIQIATQRKPFSNLLNIPSRRSLQPIDLSSTFRSYRSFNADSLHSSRLGRHSGCSKCSNQDCMGKESGVKLQIKTVQIYRNEKIPSPKPYLIFRAGHKEHVTKIDYSGGHFPIWNNPLYFSPSNKQNQQHLYEIEMWHKDREEQMLGSAHFCFRPGRHKLYLKSQGKKSGYIFIQMQLTK